MEQKKQMTLLPCPFCGGEAELDSGKGFASVACETCGVHIPICLSLADEDMREKAINKWNRRIHSEEDESNA